MKKILLLAATVFCLINLINAQAGQLDPSFGNNGIVTANIGTDYKYETNPASDILLQSDGGIYVIQKEQSYISKRRSDGSRDISYGLNGYSANAGFNFYGTAMQRDGKIVGVGVMNTGSGNDFALVRFNTNGSLDSSFSGDGKQTTDFSTSGTDKSDDWAYSVTIQKDGKIVVVGRSGWYLSLARYNTDGSLDQTFDNDGKQKSSLGYFGYFPKLAIQNDGKIVVGGDISSRLVRFNTNGSLDSTFKAEEAEAFYVITSVVIQSDGKIVVEGSLDYDQFKKLLCRYNVDGSLDKSFSGDGKQPINFGSEIALSEIALQSDGKIVLISASSIYRYNTDGSLDKAFGEDGKQNTGDSVLARAVAIQSDGKIVVGGGKTIFDNSRPYLALAKFNKDGSPDKAFDKDGKLTDYFHAGNTIFKTTAIQKDGKILAAGQTWNGSSFDFVIARYNTDGSLDNTFSNNGILITGIIFKPNNYGNANTSIALQTDGRIVVAGDFTLARYNADGSADHTFSGDGKLVTDTTTYIGAIAIQSDNKIVAGQIFRGDFFTDPSVVRYNTNGTVDKTFGVDGKHTIKNPNPGGSNSLGIHSIAFQKDGKIVLTGSSPGVVVARLNANGSTDTTFNNDGVIELSIYGHGSAAIQNDGKIVVGAFEDFRGNYNYAVRLNNDGKLDSSFAGTGINSIRLKTVLKIPSVDNGNFAAIQNDGKIVVLGAALTRYNSNGYLDSTFGNNGIQVTQGSENNIFINSIAISENKLYAVGYSSSPNNVGLVARYLLDNSTTPPTVTLTAPKNNATYIAPAAHIKLTAVAADKDGTITKVEFYKGTMLLHTETVFPYGFVWKNVPLGNYTLTAKAYDNSGNVTTSAPVHISVVPNKSPVVSITKPENNRSFAAPGYIHLEAAASDTDGRVTNVKFYNGSSLLRTEYEYPYTYHWENVPVGTYTITAVATDNWGAHTTSAPVTIRVKSVNTMMVSNRPVNTKTGISEEMSVKLYPNPATNIVNIYTKGLQQSKPATISIISAAGIVLKTVQTNNSTTQLDVSLMAKGVYTIKIISGDKVMFKQFVKL